MRYSPARRCFHDRGTSGISGSGMPIKRATNDPQARLRMRRLRARGLILGDPFADYLTKVSPRFAGEDELHRPPRFYLPLNTLTKLAKDLIGRVNTTRIGRPARNRAQIRGI